MHVNRLYSINCFLVFFFFCFCFFINLLNLISPDFKRGKPGGLQINHPENLSVHDKLLSDGRTFSIWALSQSCPGPGYSKLG